MGARGTDGARDGLGKARDDEEALAARQALAFLRPALVPALQPMKGTDVGGWTIRSLLAIGGQGILFRAHRGDADAVVKMPHLSYDRPAQYGWAEVQERRSALRFEASVLGTFARSPLPALLDLVTAPNPLIADRLELAADESFLVMESVPGEPLDRSLLAARARSDVEWVRARLGDWVPTVLSFASDLRDRAPGHFYVDFKASNVRITPEDRIRLLDAGSVVFAGTERPVPTTPGHLASPEMIGSGPSARVLEAASISALGRTLYAAATNKVLYEGVSLSRSDLAAVTGEAWAHWILALAEGRVRSIEEAGGSLPG